MNSTRLVDAVVLAVAAAEGVLTAITEDDPYVVIPITIAVLALLVRERWPRPASSSRHRTSPRHSGTPTHCWASSTSR